MNLTLELKALRTESNSLPINERARLCCDLSKRLERVGEYEQAYECLIEFWPDRTQSPSLTGLNELTKAEVLLRAGALAGCLGGATAIEGSQENAKNLITQSIDLFDKLEETLRVAEARGELALCYWREGAYDEARITLRDALSHVNDEPTELKAILLIRAGIVEVDAGRFSEAFHFYNEVRPFLEASEDNALKGSFHISNALLFRKLATTDNNSDHIDQALIEYAAASIHFEQAGNSRAVARVEGNLGFLYFTIGRYRDAHRHLDRARHLFLQLNDVGTVAQVDETRARTLLAESRLREAQRMIKAAVKTLEKGGQQALLAEALTTHGTVAARLGEHARARALLQRATEVAQTCGDLEAAGRAHLSIIEELSGQTAAAELAAIFHAAADLLHKSQDPLAVRRLVKCGLTTIDALLGEVEKHDVPTAQGSWEGFSLRREINKIESHFIERALRDAGGSVSKASRMLGFKHHQSLIVLLSNRHSELQDRRSIKRQRRRSLLGKTKREKKKTSAPDRSTAKLNVLHVEDHKMVARTVVQLLAGEGIHVDSCASGTAAWEIIKGDTSYDALIVDNNLPGLSGLELVLRVRSMAQRRNLPIIMLSGEDCEKEAWRAGVDAFLNKTEAVNRLPATIMRAVEAPRKK
jgi:CheY-like chemotaxis protein